MIFFDASIYPEAAVRQACADYREIADIRADKAPGGLRCEIRNPQGDPVLIADEFCNYVLNLAVAMGGTKS